MTALVRTVAAAAAIVMTAGSSVSVSHATPTESDTVAVYLTSRDLNSTLTRQADIRLSDTQTVSETIDIDPAVRGQVLTAGFGVAMTDTSAFLLHNALSPTLRDRAMRELFSPSDGIGLSFLRIAIGATDYGVGSPASLDDQPAGRSDPSVTAFSTAHDRPYLIPMIRQALALNPTMTVMANPWTPPAWMKTDGALVTTTGPLGRLEPQYYAAYADYLVKFLEAYRDAGVAVDYLGVQNEPLTPLLLIAGIPESFLDPTQEGVLIRDYVAPALTRARLSPGILAYDDAFQRSELYVPEVMRVADKHVAGLAYHCYMSDPSSIAVESARYPGKVQLETECASKLSNVEPQQMIIRSLRAGAQGIQLWNAALDQHGGPKMGNGCRGMVPPFLGQDCTAPITIDTSRGTYSRTSDYWALAHFSKFIHPGAHRIASTTASACVTSPLGGHTCGLENVAFENPDGSRVLVVTANDGVAHTFTVNKSGRHVTYTVPDGATATFVMR